MDIPKITFKEWSKDPKTAVMILMGSLLTIFVYAFVHSKNDNDRDCKEQLIVWQNLYTNERRANDSFKNVVIMKDETIKELPQVFDSLLKAKTKVSVKEILNGNKK